jgi:uridine kinase
MSHPVNVGLLCIFLSGVISYVWVVAAASRNPSKDTKQEDSPLKIPLIMEQNVVHDYTAAPAVTQHQHQHQHHMPNKLKVDAESAGTVVNMAAYQPIMNKVGEKALSGGVVVVGIAGGSGSGKTTLSRAIFEAMGDEAIAFISHDSYYRDISHFNIEQVENHNFDHPDALETSLLVEHVKSLKRGESVQVPTYDFSTHSRRKEVEQIDPKPIVLLEGILIFSDPELQQLIDIKVFVDTDDDIRLIRRMQRDIIERGRTVEGVVSQYLKTVQPMHQLFVEPSKRNADIIVPRGLNSVALDLVVSRLKSLVHVNHTDNTCN